ncbi:nitrilase-related carbon-nitrogen hydrolase [Longimicrobium sp.]|uniref:nitrilase-related carbon-nitrogen hydrolase n=1 Tax=Longimicrobium sp. TaxID=2029185 RepID=UPI002E310B70|nr:nitrilase-related carbon-nitrogen hydrolase [Longimicrobium sp.]HEX6038215.1 nitrilase-related carbon-nitrogen hydrolase [Longimicrobium sp.]
MTDGAFGSTLRLRIEQFAPALCGVDANLARIARAQADAAADGIGLVVTPELSVTGYDVRDAVHALASPESDAPYPMLADGPDVVLGTIERDTAFVPYNAMLHLRGGRVLHRHRKVYLPTYGMFEEGRYFGRGDSARTYDAGGGWRVGLLVCEDLWHPGLTWLLAAQGAHLVVAQSAAAGRGALAGGVNGGRFASWDAWEHLARAAAIAYGCYVALANRVGVEGALCFAGGSMIIGPDGAVLARADDLGEDRIDAELSLDAVAAARRPYAHARDDDPRLMARELSRILGER